MKPYYSPEHLLRIPDLMRASPEAAASYLHFEKQVYQTANALPQKTKELIAIATAHVSGCPYCIDVHVRKYKALGGTMEEIVEALLVAATTRAGAILSHGVNALLSYEKEDANDGPHHGAQDGPECFC